VYQETRSGGEVGSQTCPCAPGEGGLEQENIFILGKHKVRFTTPVIVVG